MNNDPAYKLRDRIKETALASGYNGICCYGFANATAQSKHPRINHGCFADFTVAWREFLDEAKSPATFFVNNSVLYRRNDAPEWHDGEVRYLTWLANGSPFADLFVTKDADDMLQNGVIHSCDWNQMTVRQAAIAVRMMREYPTTIKHWNLMVDAGLTPLDAFTLMLFSVGQAFGRFNSTVGGIHNIAAPASDQMLARLNSGNKNYLNKTAPVSDITRGDNIGFYGSQYAWLADDPVLSYKFRLNSEFMQADYKEETIKTFGRDVKQMTLPPEKLGPLSFKLIEQVHKLREQIGVENAV